MSRRPNLIKHAKKATRLTRSESYLANVKYLGEEPTFDVTKVMTNLEYMNALSWYNYMCSTEDAREYIITYLEFQERFDDVVKFKKVSDVRVNMTAAWIARILMNGYQPPDSSIPFFEQKLTHSFTGLEKTFKEAKTGVVLKFNIQDRIKAKTLDLLGDIESSIDNDTSFSLYDYLKKNNTPPSYCSDVINKYAVVLDELLEAADGKDEQLVEAYRFLNKKQLTSRISFINRIITDAEKYSENTKKTRAPQKPRPIKIETLLKNFKFQKEDNTLKLASVKPERIIGAQELWTYNTKYKTLTVYRASNATGLQIKGTSILNFDTTNSLGKSTGRKNEEFIKRVMTSGKVALRTLMNDIKTNNVFTNRINENTILLKVV